MSTAIRRISELTTNDPTLGDGSLMGRLENAAIVVDDGRVVWVGSDGDVPDADEMIDAGGAAVIPGFVDSHTHAVFAGDRCDEFESRMAGVPYTGGGIARTVAATRAASTDELRQGTAQRIAELRRHGVTTCEIKSGYGLSVEDEERLVAVASDFTPEVTFLGAHHLPHEFHGRRDDYVALVAGDMLQRCAPHARWADVFCDQGAFSVDEARHILLAARAHGLGLRLHANQLASSGGIALGVELDVASVDHCTHASDDEIESLAASSIVATLLPGAEFSTRTHYPNARRFLEAGVTVALATDCNPGTSYITSMAFIMAIAVRDMKMTCDEALRSATLGGARALQRTDVGHLGIGSRADLLLLDAPRAAHLAYRPGSSLIRRVL
ncbi:MAG: imidazolonepropionase [Actinomycetota bacterium]|jgi:imidazolonepropionase